VQDGLPFTDPLGRFAFRGQVPADGHWYICMQKPFKRMPEFDAMLIAILEADPQASRLTDPPTPRQSSED